MEIALLLVIKKGVMDSIFFFVCFLSPEEIHVIEVLQEDRTLELPWSLMGQQLFLALRDTEVLYYLLSCNETHTYKIK